MLLLFVLSFIVNMEREDRTYLSVYCGSPERRLLGRVECFRFTAVLHEAVRREQS